MKRSGQWKVKVKDYSQSTIVSRNSALVDGKLTYEGQPIKARVNVLKIGDVKMDISNILTEEGNFVGKQANSKIDLDIIFTNLKNKK